MNLTADEQATQKPRLTAARARSKYEHQQVIHNTRIDDILELIEERCFTHTFIVLNHPLRPDVIQSLKDLNYVIIDVDLLDRNYDEDAVLEIQW